MVPDRGRPARFDRIESSPTHGIARIRTVSAGAFASAARRVRAGLRFGVAARVHDHQGRILLVRMNPRTGRTRKWITPGGGAEPGESPRPAVRREIRDETGVGVRDLRLWKVDHEVVRGEAGGSIEGDFFQYTAEVRPGTLHPMVPEEIAEARWFRRLPQEMEFRDDWLRARREGRSLDVRSPPHTRRRSTGLLGDRWGGRIAGARVRSRPT
ncbi:MAG: NUDIX hydrolase [Thermoplasmata archaeon]